MTSKGPIDCRFYCDGKMLSERAWHAVPGVGEMIMMKKIQRMFVEPDHKLYPHKVVGRVFMGEGAAHNRQLVFLYVERDGWEDENA